MMPDQIESAGQATPTMARVCGWCQSPTRRVACKAGQQEQEVTHGICPACLASQMVESPGVAPLENAVVVGESTVVAPVDLPTGLTIQPLVMEQPRRSLVEFVDALIKSAVTGRRIGE